MPNAALYILPRISYPQRWSVFFTLILTFLIQWAAAQNCPANIDFETGTFNGWTCYTGTVAAVNGTNVFSISNSGGPVPDRQTMYTSGSGELDPYGQFSVNCPNGSGHSIRLGNSEGGGQAEGISYEFTIPANQNEYSLIYHYAVVFQDPNHLEFQQPRMEAEITNVSDNSIISCSSFSFYPFGSLLPGFFESNLAGTDGTPVWCKDWSAVSINLNGLAGKTIRLFFRTADCTFRRHFGYAYIDVNSECSSEFVGATYCKDDTAVNLTAPYGYQNYTWFNSDLSQVIGNRQTLYFKPPPPPGTLVAVTVVPFNGYGCLDTLYARLIDTLTVRANAGPDALFCLSPVLIGANPIPGLVYNWSPASNLSDPTIANPRASPTTNTTYILNTRHDGGGCLSTDTVLVKSAPIDSSLELIGLDLYCIGFSDSARLRVKPSFGIQWYVDGAPIPGAMTTEYKVPGSGVYFALLTNTVGCTISTAQKKIKVDRAKPGIRYPVKYAATDVPAPLQARPISESVLWTPGFGLNNRAVFKPVYTGNSDQLYTIALKTISGCITIDTQQVKIMERADIYVPTAFTPNGDGLNDRLAPVLAGIKDLRYFRIYNRWGQLLYETKDEQQGWDGTLKGVKQPAGAVVWTAEGTGIDGRTFFRKGSCVLIR
ncbi:MAG: T9SS type B sorting domain-containing protein [Chitinophagaceae bacterium]